MSDKYKHRIGETKLNFQGCLMKIIEYNHSKDISVIFESGEIVRKKTYNNFKNGQIKSLIYPNIYGIGYIGQGKYVGNIGRNITITYSNWHGMLRRCYDKKWLIKQPTYENCSVCKDWHNYQNFAKWYEDNLWDKDCICVDKDILNKGNKLYSPHDCVLVDSRLNSLLLTGKRNRSNFPIGVWYRERVNKYESGCSIIDKNGNRFVKYLGYYNTSKEAFIAYKNFKESYIKQVADEYKSKYPNFPKRLYDALYNYQVEITD